MSSAVPDSTHRPAYITITRSAIVAMEPMSWVMKRMAVPKWRCVSLSSRKICACTETSSAVVGSSAMSTAGRQASAMAIMTRWRIPPESSKG